jgi:hypothetical protein
VFSETGGKQGNDGGQLPLLRSEVWRAERDEAASWVLLVIPDRKHSH